MNFRSLARLLLAVNFASLACSVAIQAEVVSATIQPPPPAGTGYFKLGTTRDPAGHEISVNSRCLLSDGQPWFPVMGEFHYSRVPHSEWRDELLKMKAGGVDIISTYVFWIHHEEIEGQWNWSDDRDLRKFLQTCNDLGLKVLVRCGPWCHGEVRNGGFPDWVVAHKDWKLRSTDTNILAAVKELYGQIAGQMRGELWKDSGPVIGIQVDNEFGGSPGYLMALKRMAVDSGIDVPLYTKTGWPAMKTPPPLGELLPLFGAYAEGFWERSLQPMAGESWQKFTFKNVRTDTGVGNDTLGDRKAGDTADTQKYPYLTCEIGGGMPPSYHRRMNFDPRDVEALALCQLGSGSSLMGYYMYHGGVNPPGKLSTMQESTATGYPNDLPVKNYDFNAPLGAYGQFNPQYFWLRRLNLFLRDFGGSLAQMPATMPDVQPTNKNDVATLRWSVRSDGNSGFVFVNNYERLRSLPAKAFVQFKLNLPGGELVFPQKPVTIPADAFFFWPFNLDLGGVKLVYATAQPICKFTDVDHVPTFYFAETPGIAPEFLLAGESKPIRFDDIRPDRFSAFTAKNQSGGMIRVCIAGKDISLSLQKLNDHEVDEFDFVKPQKIVSTKTTFSMLQSAGPAREIPLGNKSHLAIAPTDTDFANAAVWQIKLPATLESNQNPMLRIRYLGDVARLTLNGKLLDDDFYTGRDFEIGLGRYAPDIFTGDLRLEVLPLRKDAPIFFEPKHRPDFGTNETLLKLESAEIVQ